MTAGHEDGVAALSAPERIRERGAIQERRVVDQREHQQWKTYEKQKSWLESPVVFHQVGHDECRKRDEHDLVRRDADGECHSCPSEATMSYQQERQY